jgi:flagellar hook-basal body complex protein FliE
VTDIKLRPLVTHQLLKAYGAPAAAPKAESGFAQMLKSSIAKVNDAQQAAGASAERAILGQETDLHRVMIAQEEASITFELLMEVRNKLLEAYQQVMQMQV